LLYIFFFLFRALGTQFAYREFAYREAPKIRKTTLQNSYSETQNQPRPLQSLKSRKVREPFSRISLGLAFLIIFAHIEIQTLKAEAPKYAPNQIIVKYKDPSFSPLNFPNDHFISQTSNHEEESSSQNKGTTTEALPGHTYKMQTIAINNQILTMQSLLPKAHSRAKNTESFAVVEGDTTEALLALFRKDPTVAYAVTNDLMRPYNVSISRADLPNDPDFQLQWSLENQLDDSGSDIHFLEGWALSRKSRLNNDNSQTGSEADPIIIGVIDTKFVKRM
jgi:hypothetical protein